jgi:hypothetical protein
MTASAPAPIETVISMLKNLGGELAAAGWITQLQVTAGRAPALFVRNPEPGAGALNETIYAAPKGNGNWFWWSWREPIAQGVPETAEKIRRTLRAVAELT